MLLADNPFTSWFESGVVVAVLAFIGVAMVYLGRTLVPSIRDWIQGRIKSDELNAVTLTKMEEHQRRVNELLDQQEDRCHSHVEALHLVKQAEDRQIEVLEQIRDASADLEAWHLDPDNPANVCSVHDSVGDIARSFKHMLDIYPDRPSEEQRRQIHQWLDSILARVELARARRSE